METSHDHYKNNILKFSKDYLITGINIVEDFLFWTDDQTEPKKLKRPSWLDDMSPLGMKSMSC